MRAALLASILLAGLSSRAQYYYKDILGTRESSETIRNYMTNKVRKVVLSVFNEVNEKDKDFYVEQDFVPSTKSLKTITRSDVSNESILTTYVDDNTNVIRTVDSNDAVVTITSYNYNTAGQLSSVTSNSADSSFSANETEEHVWQWEGGKPKRMLRIKNRKDTTYVDFKLDEKGNVIEEKQTHRGLGQPSIYYYYNDNNLLTDIVRFSKRANQLLPEYMFEYSGNNQLVQKITVPENSSDYLIWRYQYNAQGLKTREAIYNKQKKLTGRIEYQYSFDP